MLPDFSCVFSVTVKGSVHKLDLGNLLFNKEIQFFKHLIKTSKTNCLIYRRKAVTTGKRTPPACFIVNNLEITFAVSNSQKQRLVIYLRGRY